MGMSDGQHIPPSTNTDPKQGELPIVADLPKEISDATFECISSLIKIRWIARVVVQCFFYGTDHLVAHSGRKVENAAWMREWTM